MVKDLVEMQITKIVHTSGISDEDMTFLGTRHSKPDMVLMRTWRQDVLLSSG